MDRKVKINAWYIVAAVAGLLLIQSFYQSSKQVTSIPYSRFEMLLDQDKIDKIWISQNSIEGTLKQPENAVKDFATTRVDPDLAAHLDKHHLNYYGERPSTWLTDILSWVVPMLVFFGLWMFVVRSARKKGLGDGLMAIGKSRAKVYVEKDTKVTFADVAGVDEAKDELKEVIEFLRDPKGYGRLGARVPKGLLLVGPPGTGKTLLARGRGRGRRHVLFDLGVRVRRDVRAGGRRAGARAV
jgi:cell division protease FtsH